MIKPRSIKFGDTIGIIAPASQASEAKRDETVKQLTELGFKVKLGKSCFEKKGYLAGDDALRAEDLNSMFKDEDVDAIMCLRGGYGTTRILNLIDFKLIRKNPKIFIGYSDITAIHIALNRISKLVTFHGPMGSSDLTDDFSRERLLNAIMNPRPIGALKNPGCEGISALNGGRVEGPIIGGNLALIAATIGTPYEIDTKDRILFLEDIDEEPYSIDRMLTQLALAGKLEDAEGIILGDFKNCDPKDDNSLSLMEVFEDRLKDLDKPIVHNLKAGHCIPKITIPLGVKAVLDADKCSIEIVEEAVI